MRPFQKKEIPDFSKPETQIAFVQSTHDSKDLLQKELDVNRAEQILLNKRIQIMKSLINELPAFDPQYSMLTAQVQMDQIEVDELKVRETLLIERLS